ncbi:MAG: HDOD domain-containing protein [Betaproteobacteria bacterium]|nr:HDOD domain-containing protein [Betaproteobacteria bacterium]
MPTAYPKSLAGWTEFIGRQNLPILRHTAAKVARMRAFEDELDARNMADDLRGDPLLALRTFAQLAALRGRRPATDVSTLDRAILMMGITPFLSAFKDVPMVECGPNGDKGAYRGLLRVLRRAQHAQNYAVRIAIWRNDVAAEEIGLAALLHDLTEMLVWYCAPELAERIHCMLAADPGVRSSVAQRVVLGVTLNELQQQLAKRWHLPELLVKLMDDRHAGASRVRNAVLAVNVARHSSLGWSNAALPDDFKDIGELLSVTPDTARSIIRRDALEAA